MTSPRRDPILVDEPGTACLLGNEAIVRGALEAGVAFACENSHPSHGLRLSLDCSGSRNVRSDRADGALRAVVDVPPAAHGVPGAVAVLTLLPLNLRLDWKFAFTWKSAALQRGACYTEKAPAADRGVSFPTEEGPRAAGTRR